MSHYPVWRFIAAGCVTALWERARKEGELKGDARYTCTCQAIALMVTIPCAYWLVACFDLKF